MNRDMIDKMVAAGRPVAWLEMLAQYRPDAAADWKQLSDKLTDTKAISPKIRQFIIVAIDAVDAWPGIKPHYSIAFENGATVPELVDVCIVAGWLKGPHALNYGLNALHEVIEQRVRDGLPVPGLQA